MRCFLNTYYVPGTVLSRPLGYIGKQLKNSYTCRIHILVRRKMITNRVSKLSVKKKAIRAMEIIKNCQGRNLQVLGRVRQVSILNRMTGPGFIWKVIFELSSERLLPKCGQACVLMWRSQWLGSECLFTGQLVQHFSWS